MIHRIATLCLSLTAALAATAIPTSAAAAEPFVFASEAESTTLNGEQLEASSLTGDAGTVSCADGEFSGSMEGEQALAFNLSPSLTECTFEGIGTAEVKPNGCELVLVAGEVEGSTGEAGIECEEGKHITVTTVISAVTKCTIDIGEQWELKAVSFTGTGSPKAVNASIALSGLEYSQTPGTGLFACEKVENATDGEFEGTVRLKDFEGEAQANLELEPIPETLKTTPNKLTLKGPTTDDTVELENITNDSLILNGAVSFAPGNALESGKKCSKFPKKNSTCKESIKCLVASKVKAMSVLFLTRIDGTTTINGGAKITVDGC